MVQEENSSNQNETIIKFLAPRKLKHALQELAAERNVALSALLLYWLLGSSARIGEENKTKESP